MWTPYPLALRITQHKWLSYMQWVTERLSPDIICRVSTSKTHVLACSPITGFLLVGCIGSQIPNEYSTQLHLLLCLCFVMLTYFRDPIFEFNVSRDRISIDSIITSCYLFLFVSVFLSLFILTFEKPPHLPADMAITPRCLVPYEVYIPKVYIPCIPWLRFTRVETMYKL